MVGKCIFLKPKTNNAIYFQQTGDITTIYSNYLLQIDLTLIGINPRNHDQTLRKQPLHPYFRKRSF